MALPGREEIRESLSRYIEVPGRQAAAGGGPDSQCHNPYRVCHCVVAAAFLVSNGWLLAGGIVFLAGGGLDMFDGALARMTGKASPFGALMDSVFDRLGEAALFVGIGLLFPAGRTLAVMLLRFYLVILLLALIFSQGVSYLRARGEGLGAFTRDGLMTRTERVIILGGGLVADGLIPLSPLMPWILLLIRRRVLLHPVPANVDHSGTVGKGQLRRMRTGKLGPPRDQKLSGGGEFDPQISRPELSPGTEFHFSAQQAGTSLRRTFRKDLKEPVKLRLFTQRTRPP